MSEIWLTSDWHLFHNKEFVYRKRGFSSVEEMNEQILERHNLLVEPDDTVYILGDCLVGGKPTREQIEFLKRFNGNKILIYGNHDTDNKIEWYQDFQVFDDIVGCKRIRFRHKEYFLSHYPSIVCNFDYPKPIWNIHGHTHSPEIFNEYYHCYNVNVDAHDCYPVNIAEIHEEVSQIE